MLTLLFQAVPVSASEPSKLIMIYADEDCFADYNEAFDTLTALVGSAPEKRFPALFAFALEGDYALCEKLNAAYGFDAHFSGSFGLLDSGYSDYKTAIASAGEMMQLTDTERRLYTGKGVTVAVIDSGFDVSHPVFAKAPSKEVLTREALSKLNESDTLNVSEYVSPDNLYVNPKIPFAFNYAANTADVSSESDHGTHVAAVIAGNDDTIRGIAPDCQLLLMKIFGGDDDNNASELDLVSALEDAVSLGADVINMSLGTYSGYSAHERTPEMKNIAKRLNSKGIAVVCAAGNDGTIGYNSIFGAANSVKYPLAEITDYGTVNSPSSMTDFISVASAQNRLLNLPVLVHTADGRQIAFSDSNVSQGVTKVDFSDYVGKQEFEYICIPGVGKRSDYAGLELSGKIALIERGTITFAEKVKIAADCGAAAAIVYDNSDEGISLMMSLEDSAIPAVFISKEDGEFLKKAEDKRVAVDPALRMTKPNPNAFAMSAFSSWGVTPELELKPDITAVGESIYSAGRDSRYVSLSGTSMAAPFVSGFAALLCESFGGTTKDSGTTIKTALMNTATPLIDKRTEAEYSPRLQGAGLANISAALSRKLKLTSEDGAPSLSLGDKLKKSMKFDIVLENISNEPLKLRLSASLLGETATELGTKKINFNSLTVKPLELSEAYIGESKLTHGGSFDITLAAGSSETLTVSLRFDETELSSADFKNGFFIDGYIYAVSTDSQKYVLPFTGFTADFDKSPYIDASIYDDGGLPFLGGTMLLAYSGKSAAVLGSSNLSANAPVLDSAKIAFSPDFDGNFDCAYIKLPLYRNITGYSVEVKNASGETVMRSSEKSEIPKSGYHTVVLKLWDGGDGINDKFRFDDGDYTVTVKVWQIDSSKAESIEFPIVADTMSPSLTSYSLEFENGRMYLKVSANDNHFVREAFAYPEQGDERFSASTDDGSGSFRIDISGYNGKYLWLDITDYAMNSATEKLELSSLYPHLPLDFLTNSEVLSCAPTVRKFGAFAEVFNSITAEKECSSK